MTEIQVYIAFMSCTAMKNERKKAFFNFEIPMFVCLLRTQIVLKTIISLNQLDCITIVGGPVRSRSMNTIKLMTSRHCLTSWRQTNISISITPGPLISRHWNGGKKLTGEKKLKMATQQLIWFDRELCPWGGEVTKARMKLINEWHKKLYKNLIFSIYNIYYL